MNRDELLDLWITALESGNFIPTKHMLRNNIFEVHDNGYEQASEKAPPKYCCLGVLCEATREAMQGEWIFVEDEEHFYYYYPDEIPAHTTTPIETLLLEGINDEKVTRSLDTDFSYLPQRLVAALHLNCDQGYFDIHELSEELRTEILETADLNQLQDRDDWETTVSLARLNDAMPSDQNTFNIIAKILRERPESLFQD